MFLPSYFHLAFLLSVVSRTLFTLGALNQATHNRYDNDLYNLAKLLSMVRDTQCRSKIKQASSRTSV
jgi:hypothetical protein